MYFGSSYISQIVHLFSSFPCESFICETRAGKNTLRWSLSTLNFLSLCLRVFAFGCLKSFLLSCSVVYACDLRTEGCASRLVFYQTMKHGVFMHTSLLAAAYVFTSDLTLLLLTPTSLLSALIPPHLSFYPLFPPGMWLMLHRLFVHTAQVSLRIDGSVFLGSSGSGERQREPWSCLTGTKPEEEKR